MASARRDGGKNAARAASALEGRLGYAFADPALLDLALTHRSYTYEGRTGVVMPPYKGTHADHRNPPGTDNEQMEFLGDAILGAIVAEALFRAFPDRSEGELTRMRSALVSRERMAELGVALALGDHLKLGKGAAATGGRQKPAMLANATEAVLAAVFLDAGAEGYATVRKLLEKHLLASEWEHLRAALESEVGRGVLRDSKTLLQERVQASARAARLRYNDAGRTGPAHDPTFSVELALEFHGESLSLSAAEGSSKKEAQQKAAGIALAAWPPAGLDTLLQSPAPSPETAPA